MLTDLNALLLPKLLMIAVFSIIWFMDFETTAQTQEFKIVSEVRPSDFRAGKDKVKFLLRRIAGDMEFNSRTEEFEQTWLKTASHVLGYIDTQVTGNCFINPIINNMIPDSMFVGSCLVTFSDERGKITWKFDTVFETEKEPALFVMIDEPNE